MYSILKYYVIVKAGNWNNNLVIWQRTSLAHLFKFCDLLSGKNNDLAICERNDLLSREDNDYSSYYYIFTTLNRKLVPILYYHFDYLDLYGTSYQWFVWKPTKNPWKLIVKQKVPEITCFRSLAFCLNDKNWKAHFEVSVSSR